MSMTPDELKEILLQVTNRIQNTSGDKLQLSKLEDIKRILQKIQDSADKNNFKDSANTIGKIIASEIASKLSGLRPPTSNNNPKIEDLINNEFKNARQEFIDAFREFTKTLQATQRNLGGQNAGNNSNSSNNNNNQNSGSSNSPSRGSVLDIDKASRVSALRVAFASVATAGLGAAKMAVESLEDSASAYRRMQSLGQSFTQDGNNAQGGIVGMRAAANDAGMTLEAFVKALESGGTGMRQLGGRDFAALSIGLRNSLSSIGNLALTVDQTNSALSDYIEIQKYNRSSEKLTQTNVNQGFKEMMLNATGLAAAFGMTRDEVNKGGVAAAKDADFQATIATLPEELKQKLDPIADILSKTPAQKEMFTAALNQALGNAPTESSARMQLANPALFEGMADTLREFVRNGGDQQKMLEELQRAGVAGEQYTKRNAASAQTFSSQTDPVFVAGRQASQTAKTLAGIDPKLAMEGIRNAQNPDNPTVQTLNIEGSRSKIAATVENMATGLMIGARDTISSLLNNFHQIANKGLSENTTVRDIAQNDPTIRAVDKAGAAMAEALGPTGLAVVAFTAALVSSLPSITSAVSGFVKDMALIRFGLMGIGAVSAASTAAAGAGAVGAGAAGAGAVGGIVAGAGLLAATGVGAYGTYLNYQNNMATEDREKLAHTMGYNTSASSTSDETGQISNTFSRNNKSFSDSDVNEILKRASASKQPITPELLSKIENQISTIKKIESEMGALKTLQYGFMTEEKKKLLQTDIAKKMNLADPNATLEPAVPPAIETPLPVAPIPPAIETPLPVAPAPINTPVAPEPITSTPGPMSSNGAASKPSVNTASNTAANLPIPEDPQKIINATLMEMASKQIATINNLNTAMQEQNFIIAGLMTKIEANTSETSRNVLRNPNQII